MEDSNAQSTYPANATQYRQWCSGLKPDIPFGKCHCGCGQDAPIAKRNDSLALMFKGEPRRYVLGHATRKRITEADYTIQGCGYKTPCWLWNGSITPDGYARFGDGKEQAHRTVFKLHGGNIPTGEQLDHLCRVRSCVNPSHLEAVSQTVNAQRGLNAKLTTSDALEIRRLYDTGLYTHKQISERFNVSRSTITCVMRRKTWNNV